MTRQHGRRDGNQNEIVAALRRAGYFVIDLADLGNGVFDLLVVSKSKFRLVTLMEVKIPGQWLTPEEQIFYDTYPGEKTIVFSMDEALAHMALLDELEAI